MAALLLLAQTVVAVHGVVHLSLGDDDHCQIAQFAPFVSGVAPATVPTPDLPRVAPPPVAAFAPVLRAAEPLRSEPVRGPPVPA